MKILYFLLIILIGIDGSEPHTVMAVSGLNLRDKPSLESKVLKKLPFGSVIYSVAIHAGPDQMDNWYKKDTINGVIGHWIDAELKKDKIEGFVFSPYVYYGEIIDNKLDENTIRFSQEGFGCGEVDFHPKLDWYGLYKRDNKYYLEEIEIDLILSKLNYDKEFQDFIGEDEEGVMLKTNKAESSQFIIGTKKNLKPGNIASLFQVEETDYNPSDKNGFLYPEEKMNFHYESRNYELRAFEKINIDSTDYQLERKYELEFSIYDSKHQKILNQKFSQDLMFCCDAKMHAQYQTPQIYWVGDINSDKILDLILYQHTMTEGCGVCWTHSLFLSNIKNGKLESIKFEDAAIDCSCI